MTARYHGCFGSSQLYLDPADNSEGVVDGTSSESSASSPLNSHFYKSECYEGASWFMNYSFPAHDLASMAALGMIPVELDIQGLCEAQDHQMEKNGSNTIVPLHIQSRRRAQNRASQRAYRARQANRMKELEEKLTDLQGRHGELTQSYETLQLEYSAVKQELETLRNNYENVLVTKRRYLSSIKEWDAPRAEPSDLLLFDASAFCYEAEEESGHKGQRG